MKRQITAPFLLTILLVGAAPACTPALTPTAYAIPLDAVEAIKQYLVALEQEGTFSGSVLITQGDQVLLRGGRTPAGEQLISQDLLREYTARHAVGWDRSLKTIMAVGRGFVVGAPFFSSYGWGNTKRCFGHGGGFCTLAFGDYEHEISVALITNGNRSMVDFMKRSLPIAQGLRKACLI